MDGKEATDSIAPVSLPKPHAKVVGEAALVSVSLPPTKTKSSGKSTARTVAPVSLTQSQYKSGGEAANVSVSKTESTDKSVAENVASAPLSRSKDKLVGKKATDSIAPVSLPQPHAKVVGEAAMASVSLPQSSTKPVGRTTARTAGRVSLRQSKGKSGGKAAAGNVVSVPLIQSKLKSVKKKNIKEPLLQPSSSVDEATVAKTPASLPKIKTEPEEVDDPIYVDSESSGSGEHSSTFIVEKVLKHKLVGTDIFYKVKWQGYKKCTWEPLKQFNDFTPIQDYFLNILH